MKYTRVWQIMDNTSSSSSRGRALSAKELLEAYVENILVFAGYSDPEVTVSPNMGFITVSFSSQTGEVRITREEIEHLEIFNEDSDHSLVKLISSKAGL